MEVMVACSCGLSFPCGVPGFLVTWGKERRSRKNNRNVGK